MTSSLYRLHDHTQLYTSRWVRLLWTSDQLCSETWQHKTITRDIHAPGGIEPTNPASEPPQKTKHRAVTVISQYYVTVVEIRLVQVRKGSRYTLGEREREGRCCNTMHSNCDDTFLCWLCGPVISHSGHSPTFLFEWSRIQYTVRSDTELQVPGSEMWAVW